MRTILPLLLLITACAPRPEPATPLPITAEAQAPAPEAPSAENAAQRHLEVLWFRTSAEYRALALQTYRMAWSAVQEHAADLEAGSWAVIMDADETVLDNSEFERRIAETGVSFEEHMWDSWVMEEAAGLIPGARDFITHVRQAGGRVAIVTNRDERLCPATRRNLDDLGIHPAVVLCERETSEKEPRFRMVQEGTASDTLPPLEVVAWIGDNIQDFPGLGQDMRTGPATAYEWFGDRYFALPNPMYGSWMGNDWR